MKFFIEHFVVHELRDSHGKHGGYHTYWERIAGSVSTSLRAAEQAKLDMAKGYNEDIRNFSIVVEVDDELRGRL